MVVPASLKAVPLFHDLDDDVLAFLAKHVVVKDYEPDEVVCRERDDGDALYIVENGELAISKVIDWDDMSEKLLATVGKDTFIGEMSFLDNQPRSATVKSVGKSRLLIVKRENFLKMLQTSSLIATKILLGFIQTINNRLRQTNLQLVTLYDTGKIIGSVRDLATLVADIMERVTETLEATRGLLVLQNPYSGELEIKNVTGYTVQEEAMFSLKKDRGLMGQLFETGSLIHNKTDPAQLEDKGGFETASMLLCPLVTNEVVIGAIVVGQRETGEPFTSDDINLINGVAAQVATAVENARMVEEREAKERHDRVFITY